MNSKAGSLRRLPPAAVMAVGVVLFCIVMFRDVLLTGNVFLFTTDDGIGYLASLRRLLPSAFMWEWLDQLLGMPGRVPLSWTYLLLWVLPLRFFVNWNHAINLGLASFFLMLFLRNRKLSWPACALGALAAFWVGSNFTLTYAGHISKFGVLMFAAAYLWLIDKAVREDNFWTAVLAGGALGGMFIQQVDVGLFFALALGPYALLLLFRDQSWSWGRAGRLVLPMLATAFLLAVGPLLGGYLTAIKGVSVMAEEKPSAKWDYVTQWSWPPEESIDFVAPGYMGWRSGEPEGPYYGRMGRSSGWEVTRQGFQNFKLENQYLGAVPLILAAFASCAAFWRRSRDANVRNLIEDRSVRLEIMFWSVAVVLTLLLSFGKYFPLYALFYHLPVVSSVRNPNKFLQVFQLALGVTAAYGFDLALNWRRQDHFREK